MAMKVPVRPTPAEQWRRIGEGELEGVSEREALSEWTRWMKRSRWEASSGTPASRDVVSPSRRGQSLGKRTMIPPSQILEMHHLPSLLIPLLSHSQQTLPRTLALPLLLQTNPHPLPFLSTRRRYPCRLAYVRGEVSMAFLAAAFDEGGELDDEVD